MQKQILNFPTVNVPLPTDLFLISHSGLTSNITLNTVSTYTLNKLGNFLSPVNSNINLLSASGNVYGTNILVLSANLQNLNTQNALVSSNILKLSALEHIDITKITSDVNALSSDIILLNIDLNSFKNSISNSVDQLSSWSLNIDSAVLYLNTGIDLLSSCVNELSSKNSHLNLDVLSLSSASNLLSSHLDLLDSSLNSLSGGVLSLSSHLDHTSIELVGILNNITELSSASIDTITGIDILNSGTVFLSSWLNSIDFSSPTNPTLQYIQTEIDLVSSYADNLSAFVDSIDFSSITNPVISEINTGLITLSSYTDALSSDFISLSSSQDQYILRFYTLSTYTDYISSNLDQLSAGVLILSSNVDSISASQLVLTSVVDQISSTGIVDSHISFEADKILGRGTLTISPSSNLYITTSGNSVNTWLFDDKGQLTLPGNLIFNAHSVDGGPYTSPIDLDLSLNVQKLNSGVYNLVDGLEGQIMYFVPKSNSIGDTFTQIYISNARYWVMDGLGHKFAVSGPFYWVPWSLNNHRLDPVYDIFPSIATAIFTDGAWNISTGGRD